MLSFVDYRISSEEEKSLENLNVEIIKIPKCPRLYDAIDGHVDIQLSIINKSTRDVIIHKNMSEDFKTILKAHDIHYHLSYDSLSSSYPEDIILNGYISDQYFIHNLKHTDKTLLKLVEDKKQIHINQGYSKCSILPIREKAVITNDVGIKTALEHHGFHILHVPYGDILLPNLNYGFIGGVGGKLSEDKIAFFGELNQYMYGDQIYKFLLKYDLEPIYLRKGKLIDRGSLLSL